MLRQRFGDRWIGAAGFSLGGNALLKYLGEAREHSGLSSAVAVSVPFDLAQCAGRLNSGLSRIYQRHLLGKLNRKVTQRAAILQDAGVDTAHAAASQSFREFDGRVVAPLFGFTDADDYYTQSSCGQFLSLIEQPTLIIHAMDDPFMTPQSVPGPEALAKQVTLELCTHGGHVGFVQGAGPGMADYWIDTRVTQWLTSAAE